MLYRTLTLLCLFAAISTLPGAQPEPGYDESRFGGLKWRLVGPFRGGRAGTATGVIGQPNVFYQGTAGGGVWKTTDAGATWFCISDGYFGGSIGAVAVAPSDPNVVYAGEGEQTVRGNVSSGRGVWRSTDAGSTWSFIGLEGSEHISRIRVDPRDPDRVYVAAMGNLWKPNPVRGVYRSTDGGRSWERILFESEKAGAGDLIIDPHNPRVLWAATWEIRRNGYRMDSGGPGSHLWKSTDGGDTWTKLTDRPGLPEGVWGIVGSALSPVQRDRVWVIIEAAEGGVFRSDDGGDTWIKTNEDRALRQRAWYYSRIYADTEQADTVYVLNVSYHRSKDGGFTFEAFNAPHGDHHDLWIDPADNRRMVMADDGGAQVSVDGGTNWTTYHNQPTAQFYRVTTDNHFPFRILGAQQDNSTIRIAHRTPDPSINESHWEPSAGGESAHLAPDPDDPEIVYGGTYKGYMMRMDHRTGQIRSTNVWPFNPAGSGVEVMKYRFNWNFPLLFSPHDSNRLYAGSNHLHVTTDGGMSWSTLSDDLTRNDPETLRSSGGPITQDNTGVEYYGTIFAVGESPHEAGVIWTGSDDGLVHVTRDGGRSWTEVTPPDSPRLNMMNCIDVHPTQPGGAYLAATSYKFGDYTPYLWKTTDYGRSWTRITRGIPATEYTRAIRADPDRDGLLYAGTEWGMYVSFNDGDSWQPLQLNLPITSIRDLHVRDKMLIAATHGRSFWMIDDLSPLHQVSDQIAAGSFHLYAPKPAYRMARNGRIGNVDSRLEGENHPDGVIFNYFVDDPSQGVELSILDSDGAKVVTFSSAEGAERPLEVRAGGNRLVWDLRYPGFVEFEGMVLYASPNQGPRAVPGAYRARLSVGGRSVEQPFEVAADPRLELTRSDYQAQFNFLTAVRDRVDDAHEAIREIRQVKSDLEFTSNKLPASQTEFLQRIERIASQLSEIESSIHQVKNRSRQDPINYGIRVNNRLAFLMADQQRGDHPPTEQARQVFEELSAELEGYLEDLEGLVTGDLARLSQGLAGAGFRLVGRP